MYPFTDDPLFAQTNGNRQSRLHARDTPVPLGQVNASVLGDRSAGLSVHCLGDFEVLYAGTVIPLHRHTRAQAVLKRLAVHREGPLQRERLADAIWPDSELHAALDSLNTAVSTLRRLLRCGSGNSDRPLIGFRDGSYLLDRNADVMVDIDEFERWSAEGRRLEQGADAAGAIRAYERANTLYHGDLLASDVYIDWTVMERERLLSMFLTMLGRLASLYFDAGRYAKAIDCGFQLLGRDPCREDIHQVIMRSYCRMGHRSRALRHFDLCTVSLRLHLGLAPDAELTALRAAIVGGGVV